AVTQKVKSHSLRFIIGCMILCVILFIFPMLRGQGYDSIEQLLLADTTALTEAPYMLQWLPSASIPCLILLAVFFLKPAASALTIQNGDGGIFAPTMFIGAYAGFFFAQMFNKLGIGHINTCNFAAIGICGVFAAVMRSPLAAVFLVVETTEGFGLLVPLMLASAVSCIFGRMMEPYSIYKKSLIAQGLISEDPLESRLKRIPVGRCFVSPPVTFRQDMLVGDALSLIKTEALSNSLRCVPVLNADGTLAGLVQLTELFDTAANTPAMTVKQVMHPPVAVVHDTDTLDKVVRAMNKAKTNILPVLYFEDEKFVGLVSKESIFDKYVK
ncbi:MAG: chloride channel protein, partial [Victivallales bacterium]|nr:chloride channel protein [Victivallales bacterium]